MTFSSLADTFEKKEEDMGRFMGTILIFVLIVSISSCATIFKGTTEEVNFNSDPQRAYVYINGQMIGQTPVAIKLESKKTYIIEFRAPGYLPKSYNISNHVGAAWVILDFLGALIPVIIDAATGAWYHLDQKNVNAILERQQP